jgi:DNA-binding GntR family transcriptional regulator
MIERSEERVSDSSAEVASLSGLSEVHTADRVATELRSEILRGHLLPGSRLKDAQLAAQFRVSRNTVREALRLLVADGLVVTRLHAGSSVRRVSEHDVRDIYRVRRTIEIAAVLDSSHASEAGLRAVSEALDLAAAAAREALWQDAGTASLVFHQAIVGLCDSERLNAFFANILAQLRLVFAVMPDEPAFQRQWVHRDRRIADLLLGGRRSDAAAELARYLDDSEALVIDAIRASRHRTEGRTALTDVTTPTLQQEDR